MFPAAFTFPYSVYTWKYTDQKKNCLHSFRSTGLFLYPLKTSENLQNVHKIFRKTNISYLLIRTRYWKKSCEESCMQFLCVRPN